MAQDSSKRLVSRDKLSAAAMADKWFAHPIFNRYYCSGSTAGSTAGSSGGASSGGGSGGGSSGSS